MTITLKAAAANRAADARNGDAHQPQAKGGGLAQGIKIPPRRHKGLLGRVLGGMVITQDREGIGNGNALMLLYDRFKGMQIAALGTLHS